MKFALYFGNRGFFPESLVASARKEMIQAVTQAGHSYLNMEETRTKFGAITNAADGYVYAQFLKEHEGEYDGIIMCLPNYSDENGAVAAMRRTARCLLWQVLHRGLLYSIRHPIFSFSAACLPSLIG